MTVLTGPDARSGRGVGALDQELGQSLALLDLLQVLLGRLEIDAQRLLESLAFAQERDGLFDTQLGLAELLGDLL